MKKVKVLYLISTLRRCGPTSILWNTVQALDKSQFDLKIATMSPEGEDTILGEVEDAGVEVYRLNCGRLWPVTSFFKLRKVLGEFQPDIIHSHGVRPDIAMAITGRNVLKVSTIHNVPSAVYTRKYGRIIGRIMTISQLMALLSIDYPVSCSKGVKAAWQQVYDELYSDVVCNGIPVNPVPDRAAARQAARRSLGMPDDLPVFVSTGGLSDWKCPDVIIKAFRQSRMGEQGILILCGTGNMISACQSLASGYKNIIFTGQVTNVTNYLLAADYFVSASELEGLPNSVLEAMALELPVILSLIPAHSEILFNDTQAGRLFIKGSVEELAEALDKVELLGEDAGQRAREIVERYYTSQVMGDNYSKLYLRVTGRGGE